VQRLHNFCSEDLGAFYLDILKDRLYTTTKDGQPRRAAQSALWHILQTLTRLMAPILSFTAEEIWALSLAGWRWRPWSWCSTRPASSGCSAVSG
jgi:isoleucyl-tRNA synthetase